DSLTGLPNRWAMDRMIRTEILRRSRHPAPIALAVIDVDHFKEVNTRFHLPGGDHALIWLSQVLSTSVRAIDSVGRIGGEEFLVLAPDPGPEGALSLAERIRQTVGNGRTTYNGDSIRMTVSVEASAAESDRPATYEQLKEQASAALTEAK